MDIESTDSKFKLDGNIESPKESKYVRDVQAVLIQRLKIALLISGFLFVALLVIFIWQSSKTKVNTEVVETLPLADSLITDSLSLQSMQKQLDSLNQLLLIVQSENELLIENSDKMDGIFFEVLIGGFEDFKVDRYVSDLAKAKRRKFEGTDRMVVARFRSFKKALLFENDLKRIGIKNVAIGGSVNGQAVSFKEALEVSQQKK